MRLSPYGFLDRLNTAGILESNPDMGLVARRSSVLRDGVEIWRCRGNIFKEDRNDHWSYLGFIPRSEYSRGTLKEASTIYNLLKEGSCGHE